MKNKHLLHLFWVLLALPLFWAGCDLKEKIAAKFEPTGELPPITSEGVGSFGCLVNGEVWLPKGPLWGFDKKLGYSYHEPTGGFHLDALKMIEDMNGNDSIYQSIALGVNVLSIGSADSLKQGDFIDFNLCSMNILDYMVIDRSKPWEFHIHYLNTQENIIAGTFSFTAVKENCPDTIHITEGRFDIHY